MLKFIALALAAVAAAAALVLANAPYDVDTAIRSLYYAKVAYCGAQQITQWDCGRLCSQKFPNVTDITVAQVEDDASTGYVFYNRARNEIVLGFRGTVNLIGWLVDFTFNQVSPDIAGCDQCKVHAGFNTALHKLSATLYPALHKLARAHPSATVQVGGHSMGAALASLAYGPVLQQLRASGFAGRVLSYTFGEPRVSNDAYVAWLWRLVEKDGASSGRYRVSNYCDPITRIPPRGFDELFHQQWLHAPREAMYKDPFASFQSQALKMCNGTIKAEDESCLTCPLLDRSMLSHTTYGGIGLGCFL